MTQIASYLSTVHSPLLCYEQKPYIIGGGNALSFKTILFQLSLQILMADRVKAKVIA